MQDIEMSHKDIDMGVEEVQVGMRLLASTLKQMLLQQEELLITVASIDAAYPTVHEGFPIPCILGFFHGPDEVFQDITMRMPVLVVAQHLLDLVQLHHSCNIQLDSSCFQEPVKILPFPFPCASLTHLHSLVISQHRRQLLEKLLQQHLQSLSQLLDLQVISQPV